MAKESHYLSVFGIIPLGLKNKHYLLESVFDSSREKALDDNLNGKVLHYLSNTRKIIMNE